MVVTNKNWFKTDLAIRIWGLLFFIIGAAIYGLISTFAWMDYINNIESSAREGAIVLILKTIFFPGLIPLLVSGFFLIFFKKSQDFFIGVFVIVPIFIVFHYVVAVVSAHENSWWYIAFQLFEILCAIFIVSKYRRKWNV